MKRDMSKQKLPAGNDTQVVGRLRTHGLIITLSMTLAACAVGPDYQRPSMDVGDGFKQAAVPAATEANVGWVQADPDAAEVRADWWKLYADDTLNALMEALPQQNLDIRLAEARYRQAQAALLGARAGFYPTVGTNVSVERTGSGGGTIIESGTRSFGGGASNTYALSGSVSWEVDLWGRVRRSG